MPSRKKGLTLEQHQKVAADLLDLQEKIAQIHLQICKAYGVSKRICKRSYRLRQEVREFKSDMDSAFFADLGPSAPDSPYYPKKE